MSATMKTLLVGGGITSSLIGFFLRTSKVNIVLDLWEMEEEVGGRMKTIKSKYARIPADIGAQYITTDCSTIDCYKDVYNSLFRNDILREMTCVIRNMKSSDDMLHYIAPDGMSSLVRHFIHNNFHDVCTSYHVTSLNVNENKVQVETANGIMKEYEAVVLTIPAPDILKLNGNLKNFIDDSVYKNLAEIKFSSRYTLVLIYENELNVDWAATYNPEDFIFRFIAIQEKKRNLKTNQSSVIIHTSVEFGEKYALHDSDEVKLYLTEQVLERFPEWKNPIDTICYKWEHSQVISSYPGAPKSVVISQKPLIILAGDSFTRSNFNSCIDSAKAAADVLIENR